jgi:hypothetical protein
MAKFNLLDRNNAQLDSLTKEKTTDANFDLNLASGQA